MDTSGSITSLQRRLNDLSTFQLPRLRDCRGPLGLHTELADELRLDLEGVRKRLEVIKEEIDAGLIEGLEEEQKFRMGYDALEREYKRLRVEYRSAVLSSKRQIVQLGTSKTVVAQPVVSADTGTPANAGASSSSSSNTTYPPKQGTDRDQVDRRERSGDDAVQTKTNEVTDALRRTLGTMQVELERSVLSVQMLEDSTRTLRTTSNLYDTYSSLLHTSSQLVKALERADWYDRLLIALAFLLFLLTVGWVIKRRVLDKVVGGVGWWVGGSWRLVRMGLGGGGGGARKTVLEKGVGAQVLQDGGKEAVKRGKEVAKALSNTGGSASATQLVKSVSSALTEAVSAVTAKAGSLAEVGELQSAGSIASAYGASGTGTALSISSAVVSTVRQARDEL